MTIKASKEMIALWESYGTVKRINGKFYDNEGNEIHERKD